MKTKAIGFNKQVVDIKQDFHWGEIEVSQPQNHDLLIKVKALGMNPIDIKTSMGPKANDKFQVVGFDGAGEVVGVGELVTDFKVGDQVFYAGSNNRPGSAAEYQLVDERIVGKLPQNISLAQAVAMPLTSLTAYESLFEKLRIDINNIEKNKQENLLILNGAGGVGSVAIQLANLAGLNVSATGGRPESIEWIKQFHPQNIFNHYQDLVKQAHDHDIKYFTNILNLANYNQHESEFSKLIGVGGTVSNTVATTDKVALNLFKDKSAGLSFESVFAKYRFKTSDMNSQGKILNYISESLDQELIMSTVSEIHNGFTMDNYLQSFSEVKTGKMVGKSVIIF